MSNSSLDVTEMLAQGDFEMIEPPVNLKDKVRPNSRSKMPADPVAEAEKALQRLSTSFNVWMRDEIDALVNALQALRDDGVDRDNFNRFYRAAHDIKGQAATLGYPIAGNIAASLCNLIEGVQSPELVPMELVEQHVQAVRAIVSERVQDESDQVANALANRLHDVTKDYLESLVRKT